MAAVDRVMQLISMELSAEEAEPPETSEFAGEIGRVYLKDAGQLADIHRGILVAVKPDENRAAKLRAKSRHIKRSLLEGVSKKAVSSQPEFFYFYCRELELLTTPSLAVFLAFRMSSLEKNLQIRA